MIEPGSSDRFPDGLVRRKIAPSTIVCQCLIGRYEMRCLDQHGFADPGEVFLACTGDPLHIVHHHDPKQGMMASRWVHITFMLHGTVDVSSFFTVPMYAVGNGSERTTSRRSTSAWRATSTS